MIFFSMFLITLISNNNKIVSVIKVIETLTHTHTHTHKHINTQIHTHTKLIKLFKNSSIGIKVETG